MRAILFLATCFLSVTLTAQLERSWIILDAETGETLPYVNIGIPDRHEGTVSDAKGRFTLSVLAEDQVYFSYVGYETRIIEGTELKKYTDISMQRKATSLQTIEVVSHASVDQKVLGHRLDKKGHSVGFGTSQLGTAIGAMIRVKKKTRIHSAHFHINHIEGDSMLYRLQIYDFKHKKAGKPLIMDNIIIRDIQKKGLVSVDLNSYGLVVEDHVLMALEWVEDDGSGGNLGIMFRSKKGGKNNYYTRRTSHAPFISLKEQISIAPSIRLGFYLMGTEIKE